MFRALPENNYILTAQLLLGWAVFPTEWEELHGAPSVSYWYCLQARCSVMTGRGKIAAAIRAVHANDKLELRERGWSCSKLDELFCLRMDILHAVCLGILHLRTKPCVRTVVLNMVLCSSFVWRAWSLLLGRPFPEQSIPPCSVYGEEAGLWQPSEKQWAALYLWSQTSGCFFKQWMSLQRLSVLGKK